METAAAARWVGDKGLDGERATKRKSDAAAWGGDGGLWCQLWCYVVQL